MNDWEMDNEYDRKGDSYEIRNQISRLTGKVIYRKWWNWYIGNSIKDMMEMRKWYKWYVWKEESMKMICGNTYKRQSDM